MNKASTKKHKKQNKTINKQYDALMNVKDSYILQYIFSLIPFTRKLNIVKHSKRMQSRLNISLYTYQIYNDTKRISQSNSDFIMLFEKCKLKNNNISDMELTHLLWESYMNSEIYISSLSHNCLQYLIPLIQYNDVNSKIKVVKLTPNCDKGKLCYNDKDNICIRNILNITNEFNYIYYLDKSITKDELTNLTINLDNLCNVNAFTISGLKIGKITYNNIANCLRTIGSNIMLLNLSNTYMKNEGFQTLCMNCLISMNKLNSLDVSANYLNDDIMISLKQLLQYKANTFVKLNLSNNSFTCNIINSFDTKEELMLKELYLSGNKIGNNGIKLIKQYSKYICNIEVLDLAKTNIQNENNLFANFFEYLTQLNEFNLSLNPFLETDLNDNCCLLKELQEHSCIKKLTLINRDSPLYIDVSSLSQSLTYLIFTCDQIDEHIKRMNLNNNNNNDTMKLITLNISDSIFTDKIFLSLNTLIRNISSSLKVLDISNCKIIMKDILPSLSICSFNILKLSNNIFDSNDIITLCNTCLPKYSELNELDLSKNNSIDNNTLPLLIYSFAKLPSLHSLNLSYISFNPTNTELLIKIINTKSLPLTHLTLSFCNLNDTFISTLLHPTNTLLPQFKHLNISGNSFTDDFLLKLSHNLKSIEHLNLCRTMNISLQTKNTIKNIFKDILLI